MAKLKLLPFPAVDRITLSAAQSLVANDGQKLAAKQIKHEDKPITKDAIESFGLFEVATPNFNTYYPEVNSEDLQPRDEDYVYPVFRCLSEVIVRKNYDPLDFTVAGVLKASMNKLLGQTVYPNHEALVGNELGAVSKVMWQESQKIDGLLIPAGINGEFKIDGKSHTKLARGLIANPPVVHSNSVTVNFKWEQSHPKMSSDEFRAKSGTFDDKGQLVRRMVTEILMYTETSLVAHGADPFAQIIRDNKINNPQFAISRDSFTDTDGKERRVFAFSYKENLASLTDQTIPSEENISELSEDEKPKRKKMKKGLAILLSTITGVAIDPEIQKLGDDEFEEKFDETSFETSVAEKKEELLAKLSAESSDNTEELTQLKDEVVELKKFKTENESKVTLAETVHAAKLAEVQRLYKLTLKEGETPNDTIISTLTGADFKTLEIFEGTYKAQLKEKFPVACKKCGSHEVSMGSADSEHHTDPEKGEKKDAKSLSEIRDKFKQRRGPNQIHN